MSRIVERSRGLLDSKGPLSHAFFTSGQLMIEEYYTLAVIGKAGIGTPHMDGNTRWCTVTAAAALQAWWRAEHLAPAGASGSSLGRVKRHGRWG